MRSSEERKSYPDIISSFLQLKDPVMATLFFGFVSITSTFIARMLCMIFCLSFFSRDIFHLCVCVCVCVCV